MKQKITTDTAPSAPIYSQAIVSNGLIFVAGQIHLNAQGALVEGSIEEKLAQVMSNITAILTAAGAGLDNIVKLTIFVTDIADVAKINAIYPSYFSEAFPAREAVCVAALPLGASLEISVIAEQSDV